jgi:hypothetical protein
LLFFPLPGDFLSPFAILFPIRLCILVFCGISGTVYRRDREPATVRVYAVSGSRRRTMHTSVNIYPLQCADYNDRTYRG